MEHMPKTEGERLVAPMQLENGDKEFVANLLNSMSSVVSQITSKEYLEKRAGLYEKLGSRGRDGLKAARLAATALLKHLESTGPGMLAEHHQDQVLRTESILAWINAKLAGGAR